MHPNAQAQPQMLDNVWSALKPLILETLPGKGPVQRRWAIAIV